MRLRMTGAGLQAALLVVLAVVTTVPASADPSKKRLAEAIDRIVERSGLDHAFWGIEVRSLETGTLLYERNATKGFRPASTLKLVTTAAALDNFGPAARVRTTVETVARLDPRGRLLGDVYLVGRGDASLSARFGESDDALPTAPLDAMADTLVAAGVRRIEGRLIGHEGAFSGDPQGLDWMREDLDWGYGTGVSALTFADNEQHVVLTAGERPGDPAALEVAPRSSLVRVESEVRTGEAGAEEDITLTRSPSGVRLSGVLPLGRRWDGEVAVEDPALFATASFAEVLESRGVTLAGPLETSSAPLPPGMRVLATHDGVPMARLIEEVNKESQNLHAELLLRRLGRQAVGEGSTEAGLEAVDAFLDRLEVPRAGWGIKDGSGLSHTNVVTPRGLAALLFAMDRQPHANVFRDSLSVAGVDGNLQNRMRGTLAEGRVAAKTGAMQRVLALAGYATTVRGERLVFVVMVNNHVGLSANARRAMDDISIALSTAH